MSKSLADRDVAPTARGLALVLAFLALSYLEPIELAGVKFAVLWKWLAILLVSFPLLFRVGRAGLGVLRSRTTVWLAVTALVPLFSSVMDDEPAASLRLTAQRVFVLTMVVLADTPRGRVISLEAVRALPVGLLIAAVPFVTGLLEPLGESFRYTEAYGLTTPGFVGVFQNAHAASLAYGLGLTIVLWRALVATDWRSLVVSAGLAGGCAVLLAQTYARTGVAVVLAGALVLLVLLRQTRTFRIAAAVTACALVVVVAEPKALGPIWNRIAGETIYDNDADDRSRIDRASSGRLTFAREGLAAWSEAGGMAWAIGLGQGGMESALRERVGYRIPTHNGFVDALVATGVLGLAALLLFLANLAGDVAGLRDPSTRALGLALFGGWCAFLVFQGGEMPLHALLVTVPFTTAALAERRGVS